MKCIYFRIHVVFPHLGLNGVVETARGPLRSYASANGARVRTKTVRAMGEGLFLTVNSILSKRKVARQ